MRLDETAVFNCSAETLWPFLQEPEKQKQWMKGVVDNTPTGETQNQVGSTFLMKIKEGRRVAEYQGELTVVDRPRHLGVKMWGGNFPPGWVMRVDYRLSENAGQTSLAYTCELQAAKVGWFMWLMMPLFKMFGRMQLRGFLRTLKKLAEAPPAQAA